MRCFIKPMIALNILLISTQAAFADQMKCPSIETLGTFQYEGSFPYGYDQYMKKMKALAIASPRKGRHEELDFDRLFILYPMTVSANEKPQHSMRTLIEQLTLENDVSFTYRLGGDFSVDICAYILPGNDQVNALLYIDNQTNLAPNERERQQNHTRFIDKLTQELNLKTILQ
ncbi:MAG TPA: hypothetical protein DDY37_07585 [Legionella sp.]|nr:hypothetical protein [Legionella sp.]